MQNADNHNFHKRDNSPAPAISSSFILKPVINPASTIFQPSLCLHGEQSPFSQLTKPSFKHHTSGHQHFTSAWSSCPCQTQNTPLKTVIQTQEHCNSAGLMKSTPSPGYHCPFGLKINTGLQCDFPRLLPLCDGIHKWEGEIPSHLKPYVLASAMWLLRSQFKPNSCREYSCQNSGICL